MDSLAPDRQAQVTALLNELAKRPTYDRIVRGVEVVGFNPNVQADIKQADAVMAASWASYRMLSYLERLHDLNEERKALGTEIHKLREHPYPQFEAEIEAYARARILAPHLSGNQEVVLNFLCVCVQHIHSFLKILSEAVDHKLPAEDDAFLDKFRHLRNHFEHWNERLPGKKYEHALMIKTMTASEYRFQGGLRSAGDDRVYVVNPRVAPPETHIVDVSDDGVARVEKVVRETDAKVKELILERVRQHFLANPDAPIPAPEDVRSDPIIDVGWFDQAPATKNPAG